MYMACIRKHSGAAFATALAAALGAAAAVRDPTHSFLAAATRVATLAKALTALRADSSLKREIQGSRGNM